MLKGLPLLLVAEVEKAVVLSRFPDQAGALVPLDSMSIPRVALDPPVCQRRPVSGRILWRSMLAERSYSHSAGSEVQWVAIPGH
jgi:hypothetical protein